MRRHLLFAMAAAVVACAPRRPLLPRRSPTPGHVEFRLHAPEAQDASVVGSFNAWDPARNPMDDPDGDGIWEAHVDLPPGRHAYAFVADRVVLAPPDAPRREPDDFGGEHGILVVPDDLLEVP